MKVPRTNIYIRIGLRKKDGRYVSIDEVERGLKCGCICKACESPLVARKGEIRTPHFAHAVRSDCKRMGETHLHHAAKQILQDRMEIFLPEFSGREYGQKGEPNKEYLTESILRSPMHQDLRDESVGVVTKKELVQADKVRVEESLGGIRPDVIMEKKGRLLLVEIRVTHETEEVKRKEIRRRKLSCIEIDLSKTKRDIILKDLEGIVVGYGSKPAPRQWLSHPKGQERAAIQSKLRKKEFARRIEMDGNKLAMRGAYGGFGSDVVDRCPLFVSQGISNCITCKYHVAYFGSGDEYLHAELTNRKDSDVVYCIYAKLMAETARYLKNKDVNNFTRKTRKLNVRANIVELCPLNEYHKFTIPTTIGKCINCQWHDAHFGDFVYCGCKIR